MSNSKDEIKNKVLEKIRNGDVEMRPRIYFTLRVILVSIVAFLAFAASAFVISFSFFIVHESGELSLFGFGFRGLLTFLAIYPWYALLTSIALILILDFLLRHFKFNYRSSILKIFFATVFLVFAAGLLISFTPVNKNFSELAGKGELPVFGELYEDALMPHENKGEYRGTITSISGQMLTLNYNDSDNDEDDGSWNVSLSPNLDINILRVGDRVYIAGDMINGVIYAYGLKKF